MQWYSFTPPIFALIYNNLQKDWTYKDDRIIFIALVISVVVRVDSILSLPLFSNILGDNRNFSLVTVQFFSPISPSSFQVGEDMFVFFIGSLLHFFRFHIVWWHVYAKINRTVSFDDNRNFFYQLNLHLMY